jgi:hypothetical protein
LSKLDSFLEKTIVTHTYNTSSSAAGAYNIWSKILQMLEHKRRAPAAADHADERRAPHLGAGWIGDSS